jgi:hypothetical protein
MKRPAKTSFAAPQTAASTATAQKRRVTRRAQKPASKRTKRARRMSDGGSGIRETEEARAMLEGQLHSLYWWVFNAFKMKGFIQAKALGELERGGPNGSETRAERGDFHEADISPKKQTP